MIITRNQNHSHLTKQEQEEFDKAEFCHICEKELYDDDSTGKMLKVRDLF